MCILLPQDGQLNFHYCWVSLVFLLFNKEKVKQFISHFLYLGIINLSTFCSLYWPWLSIMMKFTTCTVCLYVYIAFTKYLVSENFREVFVQSHFPSHFLFYGPSPGQGCNKHAEKQEPRATHIIHGCDVKVKAVVQGPNNKNVLVSNYLCTTLCFKFLTTFRQKSLLQTCHLLHTYRVRWNDRNDYNAVVSEANCHHVGI